MALPSKATPCCKFSGPRNSRLISAAPDETKQCIVRRPSGQCGPVAGIAERLIERKVVVATAVDHQSIARIAHHVQRSVVVIPSNSQSISTYTVKGCINVISRAGYRGRAGKSATHRVVEPPKRKACLKA